MRSIMKSFPSAAANTGADEMNYINKIFEI